MVRAFGNIINRVMEESRQKAPKRFMAATVTSYSDRHAGTVVELAYRTVWVREDRATRLDKLGMSDSQRYRYSRNPKGALYMFRQDRSGRWREAYISKSTGRANFVNGGHGLLLGHRDAHHDYSF